MIDTHARKYFQPIFNKTAKLLYSIGVSANHVTIAALILGVSSGVSIYFKHPLIAVILLWLSGLMDVLDGSLARMSQKSSAWGGFIDLIFDRTVETAVIISYALAFPDTQIGMVVLLSSIIFSISIFLTVGALAEKKGIKEFYHQAGVTERTETFIFFTLFFLLPGQRFFWIYLFAGLIYFTGIQRFVEAYNIFGKDEINQREEI